jgi:hypothetical protein
MSRHRGELARAAGFTLVTIVFAVTQPLVLIGVPLALLLVVSGPHGVKSAIVVGTVAVVALLGSRSTIWWYERGWSLILGGAFVWVVRWRPTWSFSSRALTAVGLTVAVAALAILAGPDAWPRIDALMAERARQAAQAAARLLGGGADEAATALTDRVTGLQVAVFPALLAISSLGALGVAAVARRGLAGEEGPACGRLRGFRFSDHLVWVWLIGLVLILAPVGEIADRIGANAVFFMGALYVVRGMAVLLSLAGGIPVVASVIGGLVALLLFPILALVLAVMLIVGLGDTWLNLRARVKQRGERD